MSVSLCHTGRRRFATGCLMFFGLFAYFSPAQAQTMFSDEFNGSAVDTAKWSTFDTSWYLQRTQFGNTPTIAADSDGTRYAHLRIDTYNPDANYLRGTEMLSKTAFKLGTGLEFEARLRCPGWPRGLVGSFFVYGERGTWPTSYLKEEIDYELLSNQSRSNLWLNVWNDYNPRYAYNDGAHNQDTNPSVSGVDWSRWTTFKIRWLNNRTEWYANGALVRTDTTILPDDPMNIHFNQWAPESGWSTAYDGGIAPTSNPSANRSYYLDVDYVRVNTIPAASGAVVGSGSGLQATYYDSINFTGGTVSRVDPRVYFDWKTFSPNPAIAPNTFSARWTGSVQAQYSQAYTFYTRADDGVRLWVNGQKLIDNWVDQAPTEKSATINLTAGTRYPIVLEYFQNGGGSSLRLSWSSASTPKQVIPQIQLYPVTQSGDTTPPTASISTPGNNFSYRALPTATGSAADSGGVQAVAVTLQRYSDNLYWNGSAWAGGATRLPASGITPWSYSMPSLANGKYALQAIATDKAGNTGFSARADFYIDTVAPTVKVTTPVNTYSYHSLTQAGGTATDSGPGITRVTVRLFRYSDNTYWNGSAWTATGTELPASGTTNWTFNLPALADGHYYVQSIARDFVGNAGVSPVTQFYIDNVAPKITISAPVNNASYSSLTAATGTAIDVGPAVAWVRGVLIRKSNNTYWNGSTWVSSYTQVAATGTANWSYKIPALTAGGYSFQAVSSDYVGNTSYSAPVSFTITTSASVTTSTVTALSAGIASVANSTVKLSFTNGLNTASATNPLRFPVKVNGVTVTVEAAAYEAGSNTITLSLPGSLNSGDTVSASWIGLMDINGKSVPNGTWTGTAR